MGMECTYCGSLRKSQKSLIAHEATCPKNSNGYRNIPWSKGKTKHTDARLMAFSKKKTGVAVSEKQLLGIRNAIPNRKPSIITDPVIAETRKAKLRAIALAKGLGGYNPGSGRGKKGWYKGIFCDSSWELAYVVYCMDHGIKIERNTHRLQYEWEGKVKTYIPDFIVEGNLIEVKGYLTEEVRAKHEANPTVRMLLEKDLQHVFDYVKATYGVNYLPLYGE